MTDDDESNAWFCAARALCGFADAGTFKCRISNRCCGAAACADYGREEASIIIRIEKNDDEPVWHRQAVFAVYVRFLLWLARSRRCRDGRRLKKQAEQRQRAMSYYARSSSSSLRHYSRYTFRLGGGGEGLFGRAELRRAEMPA